jgi:putative sigma-54 modulation protein
VRVQVKGKNVEITPSLREYAELKLAKLDKQLAEATQVELELSEEKNPSIAASCVAEATIYAKGTTLRAREVSFDLRTSIDQVVAKLERQVKRYRDKRVHEPRRHAEHHGAG